MTRREPLHGRCPGCGYSLPNPWTDRCRHRLACEARQMLNVGVSPDIAAAHAQGRSEETWLLAAGPRHSRALLTRHENEESP